MTTRTFASWVEPIAARLREERAQVIAFARSLPVEAWHRPSPLEGCSPGLPRTTGGTWGSCGRR